jgi:hypothetical protein
MQSRSLRKAALEHANIHAYSRSRDFIFFVLILPASS